MRATQETSVQAYHGLVVPHLECPQERLILDYLRTVRSATIGEIAHALEMEKSTVSARQNNLRHVGILEFAPDKRKCTRSGLTCNVLRFAAQQLELV